MRELKSLNITENSFKKLDFDAMKIQVINNFYLLKPLIKILRQNMLSMSSMY